MIVYDFEVFKHNWMLSWLDCETQKMHTIHDDVEQMEKFYNHYKNRIWVGYNSRNYDVWIAKAILAGFNPYEMSQWLIEKGRKGFEFSRLLNNFPILNYDCAVGFRSLKELEAFMGHDIQETSVPFDIDRPLTKEELELTRKYNRHDVWETFNVFVETKHEFESHIGLIEEFNLPITMISKTKAQMSAEILGARRTKRDDEFELILPENLQLGKYEYIKDHFIDWAENSQDYKEITFKTDICDTPHVFGVGGIHGAKDKYFGDGIYILADVGSYYPTSMVKYDYLSRNVATPKKFETILTERLEMKARKDPRENPRKIVLNSTFGASKDKWNKLYDPRQANNLCIANQLFMVDLLDKLEGHCEIIQSNTDGIVMKLYSKDDESKIRSICSEWEKRTGFSMGYDKYTRVIQSNVNNYIFVAEDGYLERKGAMVKNLSPLDNDLPIVNRAIVNYFVYDIPVRDTIMESDKLIDFQKVTKISNKYEFGFHARLDGGEIFSYELPVFRTRQGEKYLSHYDTISHVGNRIDEKVIRCFASKDINDGAIYKKHKDKITLDKTPSTPENAFIDNGDILDKPIPEKLDREWYIALAEKRVREFVQ